MPQPLPPTPGMDYVTRVGRLLRPLRRFHRHRVEGLELLPKDGAWLMVTNHSLATYDGFLYGMAVAEHTGRVARGLGDKRIFQTPGLRDFAHSIGLVEASPDAGLRLLAAGEIVAVAPGGMWEALRPRSERYQVRWDGRRGFVRLALRAGVPIVLAACPAADRIYSVYGNRLTDALYQRMHIPLPLVRGFGPTLLPRRTRLTHYIAPPIHPPAHDPAREDEQVNVLHGHVLATMQGLMARRPSSPDGIKTRPGPPAR